MNLVSTATVLFVFFEITHQQNDNQRINEGASTSRDGGLSECEKCKISSYAETIVRLMLAEDRDGGDLTDLVNNHFDALQAFHDEVFSYFYLAEHGTRDYHNPEGSIQLGET